MLNLPSECRRLSCRFKKKRQNPAGCRLSVCFTLWGSDVEVLRCSLLGVGTAALLRRDVVQHDGRQSVTCRVVRPRHSSCDVSLQGTNETRLKDRTRPNDS